jgi:uncharacterized protein
MTTDKQKNPMKSFLVLLKDKSQSTLEMSLLEEHIKHLKNINRSSNLIICGPFADDTGAVLIIEASSFEHAENIIQADPFIKSKYYADYTITEFYKAAESNNWLMDHDQASI